MSAARHHCTRCGSEVEAEDLRCAICGHACPEVEQPDRPDVVVEVLRCTGCGVALSFDVDVAAPRCSFCGLELEVERPEDPVEQAEARAPFTVDREQALAAFRAWLAALGWFRPSDLMSGARLETIQPLWWIAWVFDADALVTWTADSDHGARKAAWAPHAGRTSMTFERVVVPASRGLTVAEVDALVDSYTLATELPGAAATVAGASLERFDLRRSQARQRLLAAIEELARSRLGRGHIPGRRFRNVRLSILLRGLRTRRWGLPAWIFAYRYGGTLYRAVLSGQSPGTLVGDAPYSVLKILGAIAAALLGSLVLLGALVGLLAHG